MEVSKRIQQAEFNRIKNVNCTSFWAFAAGFLEQEEALHPDDVVVTEILAHCHFLGLSESYQLALATLADFLVVRVRFENTILRPRTKNVHYAVIDPNDPSYVYHRMAHSHPVTRVAGTTCCDRYQVIKDPLPGLIDYPKQVADILFYRLASL